MNAVPAPVPPSSQLSISNYSDLMSSYQQERQTSSLMSEVTSYSIMSSRWKASISSPARRVCRAHVDKSAGSNSNHSLIMGR
ncbi:hypothetical protein RRG08_036465 [Elysia crispata]|uniref:Uncharacterized protein n=1 Tax=Elysia crispata TaxID=231223 RepID=A0AAE1DIC5_9GAST|nr:hypothetical protein RRG08_036465 [Elysia crispata]